MRARPLPRGRRFESAVKLKLAVGPGGDSWLVRCIPSDPASSGRAWRSDRVDRRVRGAARRAAQPSSAVSRFPPCPP